MKLHLYLWQGVLCDYTCGMAFAIATSKEDALNMIAQQKDGNLLGLGFTDDNLEIHELDTPFAASVWGGG